MSKVEMLLEERGHLPQCCSWYNNRAKISKKTGEIMAWRHLSLVLRHSIVHFLCTRTTSCIVEKYLRYSQDSHLFTIENNVLSNFTSTPSNRKISTTLLRPYAQTVFKVYAKVRKSAQFENFKFLCHRN